jgi:hypothetical protein
MSRGSIALPRVPLRLAIDAPPRTNALNIGSTRKVENAQVFFENDLIFFDFVGAFASFCAFSEIRCGKKFFFFLLTNLFDSSLSIAKKL